MSTADSWNEEESDGWREDWETEALESCYHCGAGIYEQAEQCPTCGNYIIDGDSHTSSQPAWVIATAILLLVLFVAYFFIALG